ncbi:LOW QUALITY PROTEIN: uncharacterized protein C14orf93 homolog [Leucoraja erinacea]|uniref:LOW QUALITY PROTEIN: uncharacterized protein C14orf93 homolog n=1 Tax=Leucoraja erinaceus TaxID=7782 RepID=UPI002456AE9A|nr:LOW QUALITY PROTEIN: uncharacterized protein C14orf93 homolog [Leucoraja erinacea]
MSFSATILFTPPGGGGGGGGWGARVGEGAGVAPVAVSGQGVSVEGAEPLLHLIYQRLQTVGATAQEALEVARGNQRLLRGLERQVQQLAGLPLPPAHPSPPPAHGAPPHPGPSPRTPPPPYTKPTSPQPQTQPAAKTEVCEGRESVPSPEGGGVSALGEGDITGSSLLLMDQLFGGSLDGTLPLAGPPRPTPLIAGTLRLPPPPPLSFLRPLGRGNGARSIRRKRDVVLSKMVHNIHNHVSNDRRFNGAESIKSAWNMGVVRFLLDGLKGQLADCPPLYTDKELKGACVAYFLTKRREYRNAMNPHRSLREREDKKLRSRRYKLFAARSALARLLDAEDRRVWEGASEELMSDEEDSALEPGVWVARSPSFRPPALTRLCRRLDTSSRHGQRPNRVQGPPSERLPTLPEPQPLPPARDLPRTPTLRGGQGGGRLKPGGGGGNVQ